MTTATLTLMLRELSKPWSVDKSPAEEKKRRAVDPWRKEMLAVSLEQLAKDQGDLMKSLPAFEPSYLKQLCALFWKNLNGKGEISGGKPVVPLAVSKRISEQAIWGHDDNGSKHLTILPGNHSFYQSTIPILMPFLENVIISKFEAGPVNTPNLIQALMALFQYYCTPKYSLPGGEIVEAAAPADISELWDVCGRNVEKLLQAVYIKQQEGGIQPRRPLGRCAETYCFVCMQ